MHGRSPVSSHPALDILRPVVARNRTILGAGFCLLLAGRAASFIVPTVSKYVVDDVVIGHRGGILLRLATIMAMGVVIQTAASLMLTRVMGIAAQQAVARLRQRVYEHVLHLPIAFFDAMQSGNLASRAIRDCEGLRVLVGTGLVQAVGGVLTAVGALIALAVLNWQLTVVVAIAGGILALCLSRTLKQAYPVFRQSGELNAMLVGQANETAHGIRLIKAYAAERVVRRGFVKGTHTVLRNGVQSLELVSLIGALMAGVAGFAGVVVITQGAHAVLSGYMSLGDVAMYTFVVGLFTTPIIELSALSAQFSEALASVSRVADLLREPIETTSSSGSHSCRSIVGQVDFEGVRFGYNRGENVLHGVSFHIEPGATVALVGPSGSGKSTIAGLLLGFYTPDAGRVLVDGRDLATIIKSEFRPHVGVVLQESLMVDGSIAENIALGRPSASMTQIRRAGRLAYCDEFVDALPTGYDTPVGQGGIRLSGGQRQRVAIARALLTGPRILIVDEPTSNLDPESEAIVHAALVNLRKDRTTLIITHRLPLIQRVDEILVLNRGTVVERGSHRTLLAAHGRYSDLWNRQVSS